MRLIRDLAPGTVVRMPDWFYEGTEQKQLFRIMYHTEHEYKTIIMSETVFDDFSAPDLHKAYRIYRDTYLRYDRYYIDETFGTHILYHGAGMTMTDGHGNRYDLKRPSRWLLGQGSGSNNTDDDFYYCTPFTMPGLEEGRKPDGTPAGYRLQDAYAENGVYYYYCWIPGEGIVARTADSGVPSGWRPVYCLRKWVEVSEPDDDGICDILPVSTGICPDGGVNGDPLFLGAHWDPFPIRFIATGANYASCTFASDLQPACGSLTTYIYTSSEYCTFDAVSQTAWDRIPSGRHTVTVGDTEYYFLKLGHEAAFQLTEPIESENPATLALILVDYEVPETGSLTVEVTNNAFDEEPTWQDVTGQVINNEPIALTNREKTADRWGYNVRVGVSRGDSRDGECLIRSMKTNFK